MVPTYTVDVQDSLGLEVVRPNQLLRTMNEALTHPSVLQPYPSASHNLWRIQGLALC